MSSFPSIRIEGGLLGPDILDQLVTAELPGQRAADFALDAKRNLTDEIAATFADARALWGVFQHRLEKMPESEIATSVTRDAWMVPFLGLLGYELRYNQRAFEVDGLNFAISHRASESDDSPPIHIVGARQELGRVPASGRPRLAPHSLMQEYLNRTEALWGMVTNGLTIRLLRDCTFVRRQAYVEFDLQAIIEEQRFQDFSALYRVIHRTRFPRGMDDADQCWLEKYYSHSVEQGGRVRDHLRDGVEEALKILANGLLGHPDNSPLREKWNSRAFTSLDFYQQLLRLIYRLLFLMVAEERGLISDGRTYREHYSVSRLRRLAENQIAYTEHSDLWLSLQTVFRVFQDDSLAAYLEVSPLNGDLFDENHTALLNIVRLTNHDLLSALWHLSMYQDDQRSPWRRINYGALDVEELGSVYESLLDYQPVITEEHSRIMFDLVSGTERKTTGSYYTPPELVNELIQSALVPVIEDRLKSARTAEQKEQALLGIKVCDPACGSGHFLLAAARRLARELARVRSGEAEPSPEEQRTAMRQVIAHSIYGVDRNPLAVDLCKVALWIEGVAHGKPLSFIDHRIRCGDSLVGVLDLEVLNEGIPSEAFNPVAGDDKAIAAMLKKRNRDELRGQKRFEFEAGDELHALTDAQKKMLELSDDDVKQARRKAAFFQGSRGEGTKWWEENMACNLWTAAFFADLSEANERAGVIPATESLRSYLENPKATDAKLVRATMPLADSLRFFNWPLEFPEVFEGGGFDVALGNPPWERIKLQEQEFFASRDRRIASAPNKAARAKLIRELRHSNADLWNDYSTAMHDAEGLSKFLRRGGRFPLTARGDINTYAVFAEHALACLNSSGRAGIIVPTGIATDDTTKHFFGSLVTQKHLVSLFDFENRDAIFPGVHRSYKFSLLTISGEQEPGRDSSESRFAFFLTGAAGLRDQQRVFSLDADDFARLNPNTRTCPIFRTRADAELTRKIYERVPVLVNEQDGSNPWGVKFSTMFHMANDSELFRTREELCEPGLVLRGNCFVSAESVSQRSTDEALDVSVPQPSGSGSAPSYLPLYEAKMIWQFDHRYGSYEGVTDRANTHLPTPTAEQYADPMYAAQPWYWVPREEVMLRTTTADPALVRAYRELDMEKLGEMIAIWPALRGRQEVSEIDYQLMRRYSGETVLHGRALIESRCPRWLMGFRDIARSTDERTAIFSLLPRVGVGHKIPLIVLLDAPHSQDVACFLANVNSLVLDYVARQKIGGTSLSFFVVKQLPVLPPSAYLTADIDFIVPRVLELVYTSWDLKPFAEDCGYAGEPFKWDEDRRALIRAELDAYYARLYGLTRDELRYILDPKEVYGEDFPGETFRVLKEREIRQYGEYRTRRLVLEAWDQLAD